MTPRITRAGTGDHAWEFSDCPAGSFGRRSKAWQIEITTPLPSGCAGETSASHFRATRCIRAFEQLSFF
jgi:hypothetical protein